MRWRSAAANAGVAATTQEPAVPVADVSIFTSFAAAPEPSPQPSPGSISKWSTSIDAGSATVIALPLGELPVDQAVAGFWSIAASGPQPWGASSALPEAAAPPLCDAQLRRNAASSVVVAFAPTTTPETRRS